MLTKPRKRRSKLLPILLLLLITSVATALLTPYFTSNHIFLTITIPAGIALSGTLAYYWYSAYTSLDQEVTSDEVEAITSHISDVIAIMNIDGVISYKSQNTKSLFGWEAEELIGQHALTNVHPKDQAAVLDNFTKILDKPLTQVEIECRYKCKNGTYKPIHIKAINLLNNPSINGIFFNYHDISKRKKTERKLKKEEYKYRTLFENMVDIICILDTDGNILETNDIASTVFEYSRDELIGMNISQLVHPEDKQVSGKYIEKLTKEGYYELYEGRIITKSGKTKWIQVSSKAIYIDGKHKGSQDIIRDISQQKELEYTLRKSTEELKKLNKTKDKFFSIIAHDLKTPFNSLLGLSAQIANKIDKFPPDKLKKIILQMHDSAHSSYQLLVNLLEWANSQRGKMVFSPEPLLLNTIISNQIELFKETASKKGITLLVELNTDYHITADKNMLMSILRNLISNALKFTPSGGEVRIKAEYHPLNTVICIQDNGRGMNNSVRRKLFKISESISTPGTENESGTGLGLILCKEFIDRHCGKIWVESKPDKGSCFRFSIPHQTDNEIIE